MRSIVRRSVILALFLAACGESTGGTSTDAGLGDVGDTSVPSACEAPAVECAEGCVDTATSNAHCGGCGSPCAAGEQCTDAQCVCAVDTEPCDGVCVDRLTNVDHCGVCGRACSGATPDCVGGQCVPRCAAGEVRCDGACVDPRVDAAHCGGCGVTCDGASNEIGICLASECDVTCATGWHDVDPAPGCEYRCDATPGRIEVCDGRDNDCNRRTDADDPGLRRDLCPLQQGVCAGSRQRCDGGEAVCDETTYSEHAAPSRYQPAGETRCDDADNDCDGVVDEDCCDTLAAPLAAHEAVAPAGFAWQVDRQARGFWDGEAVVLVWQRTRETLGGTSSLEIVLGRVGPDGGEPRAPVVIVPTGTFTAWDAVVDGGGVDVWFGDAEGRVWRQAFDLRGTALGEAVEVTAVGVAARREIRAIAIRKSPFGDLVFVRGSETGSPAWRLWKLNAAGSALGAYVESTLALPLVVRPTSSGVQAVLATYSEADIQLERYVFGVAMTRTSVGTLFPTTTWPGFVDAEFSPFGGAALIPNTESGWLELVTLTDAGLERAGVSLASEPGATAVGRDGDGNVLLAWPEAGADGLADVWMARLDGTVAAETVPEAVLTRQGRIRGFGAQPLDLIEGPERGWVVLQTWSSDLQTRRLAVYPLSAEGVPLCE